MPHARRPLYIAAGAFERSIYSANGKDRVDVGQYQRDIRHYFKRFLW